MLEQITVNPYYKLIKGDLYKITDETNEKVLVNADGCALLIAKLKEIADDTAEIAELKARIETLTNDINKAYVWVGDLKKAGFCEINREIVTRDALTGEIVKTEFGHAKSCKNYKKEV